MSEMTAAQVIEHIERAFDREATPPRDEMIAPRFRSADDAHEMVAAVGGKHWTELDTELLFHHREALAMLSAKGYRALLGAFLRASVRASRRHGPDLIAYTVSSLQPHSDTPEDVQAAEQRLALLTREQRDAVAAYLQHLADRVTEAAKVLEAWR